MPAVVPEQRPLSGAAALADERRGPALAGPYASAILVEEEGKDPWGGLKDPEAKPRSGMPDISQIGTGRVGRPDAPSRRLPKIFLSKPTVEGPLATHLVRRGVRVGMRGIEDCYRDGLSKDPSLEGTVVLSFSILPSGAVASSKVERTTLKRSSMANCVATTAKRWEFRGPPRSGIVTVEQPLSFTPGSGA